MVKLLVRRHVLFIGISGWMMHEHWELIMVITFEYLVKGYFRIQSQMRIYLCVFALLLWILLY